jgi:integrase
MGKKSSFAAPGVKRAPDGNFLIRVPHRLDPETGAVKRTWKKVYVNSARKAVEIRHSLMRQFQEDVRWSRVDKNPDLIFDELAEWYLEHQQIRRDSKEQYQKKETYLEFWKRQFGGLRVVAIRSEMIERAMNQMLEIKNSRGVAFKPATVNRYFTSLRHCFNLGVKKEKIHHNPCKTEKSHHEDNIRDFYVERDDLDRVLSHASQHLKDIALVGWYLGIRRGKLLNLRKPWVNLEEGYLVLPPYAHKTGKRTGKWRTVPFGVFREVVEILRKYMAEDHPEHDFMFTYRGKPIRCISTAWENARNRAGMPQAWFHDLRRSANTKMDQAGVPRKVIKAITGHTTDSMFERYRPVPESEVFAAVRKYHEMMVRKDWAEPSSGN